MSLSRFKLAADLPPEQPESEEAPAPAQPPNKRLRDFLMLGAAGAPFLGMKAPPKLHENQGSEFGTIEELHKNMMPGDVVLSSPHKKPLNSLGVGLGTGSPDVTHASFVDDYGRIISTIAEGNLGPTAETLVPDRTYTILRPKPGGRLNPAELAQRYRRSHDIADQLKAKHPEIAPQIKRDFSTKARGFIETPLREVMAPVFGGVAGDAQKKRFADFYKKPSVSGIHECAGGWCSLPGALAFPEGIDVVQGKTPKQTSPTDFLKSPDLHAVGGYSRGRNRLVERAIRAGPTAARLTYGVLGAAGVYGADKAIDAIKNRIRKPPASQSLAAPEPDTE